MRAYNCDDEEALLLSGMLRNWADEGLLSQSQHSDMQQETACNLWRTSIFMRLTLLLFTVVFVAGASGLFASILATTFSSEQPFGVFLLVSSIASYAGAEFLASRGFYRHGIEESLAICSVALLCIGVWLIFRPSELAVFLACFLGGTASLWIWHRFGLGYAFLASLLFVPWFASCCTASLSGQRLIVSVVYVAGLLAVTKLADPKDYEYLKRRYSVAEALLWLGIYLTVNLQLSLPDLLVGWLDGRASASEFSRTVYWTTWVLTWCVPPVILIRGLRRRDRFVIAIGAVTFVLTLITNKPYLGWQRHTWDPMLLGGLLIGFAVFLHRWLSRAPAGVRHGFTAQRLSRKEQRWIGAASFAIGLTSANTTSVNPATPESAAHFGGGDFGGGGAWSDF